MTLEPGTVDNWVKAQRQNPGIPWWAELGGLLVVCVATSGRDAVEEGAVDAAEGSVNEGVYIVKVLDKEGERAYVGQSKNIIKRLDHHFASGSKTGLKDFTRDQIIDIEKIEVLGGRVERERMEQMVMDRLGGVKGATFSTSGGQSASRGDT